MLLLRREDIQQVFSMKDAIAAVETGFSLFSQGKVSVPLRTVIPSACEDGTFLFMPAYCPELKYACLKIINMFPRNYAKGLPTSPSQVILMDGETGLMLALLDGTYLTQLRTGGATGAALKWLAKPVCRKGALIGAGGQAEAQLLAMLEARELKEISVYDANKLLCGAFAARMGPVCAEQGTVLTQAESGDEAVADADIIVTATPSKSPVFDGRLIKNGAVISAVGSYKPDMEEIDPLLVARAGRVICDSTEAVLSESGDIIRPLEAGTITREKLVGDLGEVILGQIPGRTDEEEIILFETVGIGIQDLITAGQIYQRARSSPDLTSCVWN